MQCTGLTAPVPESIQPASQSNSILETEQKRKQPVSVTAGASGQKSVSKTVPPNQNVKSGAGFYCCDEYVNLIAITNDLAVMVMV